MAGKMKGFTIVEVVIVIAIIAVLLAISIPRFSLWRAKYQLESDTRSVASLINMARNKAFTEKINLQVVINGKRVCVSCNPEDDFCTSVYPSDINCVNLKNDFGYYTISISSRGIIQNKISIFSNRLIENSYGCIRVSTLRAKVGIIKGESCELR